MITHLGLGSCGERLTALERVVNSGVPATEMLVVHSDILTSRTGPSGTPVWRATAAGSDPEALVERAFLAEWDALQTGPGKRLTDAVGAWLDDKDVGRALVRSERGCGLGTAIATGRADILRALTEVRSAAMYDSARSGVPPSLLLSRLSASASVSIREPETDPTAGQDRKLPLALARTLWVLSEGMDLLVDAGGPHVDPHDPWRASYADPLEQQIAPGRAWNRVCAAQRPFEWVRLLAGDALELRRFEEDCGLRYPGAAQRLVIVASEALDAGAPAATPAPAEQAGGVRRRSPLQARQLVGSSGSPGVAAGTVSCSLPATGETVLLCDVVSPEVLREKPGIVAIVERLGSGFGRGAILAHRLGVPRVYRLTDAHLIDEGMHAVVDGELGTVTLTSQL